MSLIIDPSEIAQEGRVELNLLGATIYAKPEGIDWGDTALENYKAQQTYGEAIVDWRLPNRVVTIPLIVRGRPDGESMIEAMGRLQAKVARLATEGGQLKRVRGGLTMYADIETAHLVLPDTWTGENRDFETEGQLVLECRPDFYGQEKTATAEPVEITNGAGTVLLEDIEGSYPARCVVTVTDEDSTSHRGIAYGFRCRHYDDASTAALIYSAEDMTPADTASVVSNLMVHSSLPSSWTPVLTTEIAAGDLTHVGAYRVLARVRTTTETQVDVRFAYATGIFEQFEARAPKRIPGVSTWYWLDLGVIRIAELPTGSHRWRGVLQAKSAFGVGNVSVDRLALLPVDESSAIMYSVPGSNINGSAFIARDRFEQTSGNLNGKTPTVGAAWQTGGNTGDFVINTSGDSARRNISALDSVNQGRWSRVGPAATNLVVEAVISETPHEEPGSQTCLGVNAHVDSNNALIARVNLTANDTSSGYSSAALEVVARVASSSINLTLASTSISFLPDARYRIRLWKSATGLFACWLAGEDSDLGLPVLSGSHSHLVEGGAIGTVYGGIYSMIRNADGQIDADNPVQDWWEINAWEPADNPLIHPDRSLEIATMACLRESADGDHWGPVVPYGDLPRLPVSGHEDRPVEVALLNSRGDFASIPDVPPGDVSVEVKYRPCWSSVPEEISAGGSGSGSGSGA